MYTNIIAAELNNKALGLYQQGKYTEAEYYYKQALELRLKNISDPCVPPQSIALSQNALGELYLSMGRLDEAEKLLHSAASYRELHEDYDRAYTRDNLGRLYEMKGDMKAAREWRSKGAAKNEMMCSYEECQKTRSLGFISFKELQLCSRCKCIYYCGRKCQKLDYKRHKQYCKPAVA